MNKKFQATEESVKEFSKKCAAWGCPLPGSMSGTVGDGSKFYCRYHFGASTDDFDQISTRVKKSMPMIARIEQLKRELPETAQTKGLTVYLRNEAFSIQPNEPYYQYINRLIRAVRDVVVGNSEIDLDQYKEQEKTKKISYPERAKPAETINRQQTNETINV